MRNLYNLYSIYCKWRPNDTKLTRIYIMAIIIYVIVGVAWYISAKYQASEYTKYMQGASKLTEMSNTIQRYASDQEIYKLSIENAGKTDVCMNDLNMVQADIMQIGKKYNLNLELSNRNDSGNIGEVFYDVVWQGRWIDILAFINDFERSKYFTRIENVSFDTGQGYETKITLRYKIYTN